MADEGRGKHGFNIIGRYMDWLADRRYQITDLVYRGQGNGSFTPKPAALRPGNHGIRSHASLEAWKRAAIRFANPVPRSDFEWLVLAQHYEVPTTLLDWSSNPLVALFFACEDSEKNRGEDGKVFAECRGRIIIDKIDFDLFNPNGYDKIFINASAMNRRSIAQEGYLSIHSVENAHDWLTTINYSFTVKSEDKPYVMLALEFLNMTAERIYDDIFKVSKDFVTKMEAWDAFDARSSAEGSPFTTIGLPESI